MKIHVDDSPPNHYLLSEPDLLGILQLLEYFDKYQSIGTPDSVTTRLYQTIKNIKAQTTEISPRILYTHSQPQRSHQDECSLCGGSRTYNDMWAGYVDCPKCSKLTR